MKITVTRGNISSGERGDPHFCPVALAVAGETGARAVVWGDRIHTTGDVLHSYATPWHVRVRIWLYDWLGYMRPFSFRLP